MSPNTRLRPRAIRVTSSSTRGHRISRLKLISQTPPKSPGRSCTRLLIEVSSWVGSGAGTRQSSTPIVEKMKAAASVGRLARAASLAEEKILTCRCRFSGSGRGSGSVEGPCWGVTSTCSTTHDTSVGCLAAFTTGEPIPPSERVLLLGSTSSEAPSKRQRPLPRVAGTPGPTAPWATTAAG
jgi:hypothetical protein